MIGAQCIWRIEKVNPIEQQIAAIEEAVHRGRTTEIGTLKKVSAKYGVHKGTLKRWMEKVKNVPRSEWETVLQPLYKGCKPTEFSPEAWGYFLEQYERSDPRSVTTAYEAYKTMAMARGWPLCSQRTIRRKLVRENLLLPRC